MFEPSLACEVSRISCFGEERNHRLLIRQRYHGNTSVSSDELLLLWFVLREKKQIKQKSSEVGGDSLC